MVFRRIETMYVRGDLLLMFHFRTSELQSGKNSVPASTI